jgi:hypothetical protein
MYFIIFVVVALLLFYWYDRSGKAEIFSAKVVTKQRRVLARKTDLFYVEIWHDNINGKCVYGLFVEESDFNRLWEDDTVAFTAQKGKLTGWLYNRKLVS